VLSSFFHEGGVVGQSATQRYVHPAYFEDAPRYHSGGLAGLRPNEVPAILERGERIIPKGKSAGGDTHVNVSFTNNGGSMTDSEIMRHSETIAKAVRQEIRGFSPHLR
jgi:hypothetical protein